MTGDFNMMENPLDRSTSLSNRFLVLKKDLAWTNIRTNIISRTILAGMKAPLLMGQYQRGWH